jgi:outer membrane biosynthesis protein TonB
MRVGIYAGPSVEYPSMRLSVLSTAAARAGALCCVLFLALSAQSLAQTSATDTPAAAQPAEEKPPVAEDKPATAEQPPAHAEEKPAIAQEKPAAVEPKPAAAEIKPVIVEQTSAIAAKTPVAEQKPTPAGKKVTIAHSKPVAKPKPAAKLSRVASRSTGIERSKPRPARATRKPRERTLVMLCTGFRTYNASSGTYRGYDGKTHSCR